MSDLSLDIPSGLTGAALTSALNDRLRTIAQALPDSSTPGILDMQGYRIINLGDPINPQDAVNLRTLNTVKATSVTTVNTTQTSTPTTASTTPAPIGGYQLQYIAT